MGIRDEIKKHKKVLARCDTKVSHHVKKRLEEIAVELRVKRADVSRAAFARYIRDYDEGLIPNDKS